MPAIIYGMTQNEKPVLPGPERIGGFVKFYFACGSSSRDPHLVPVSEIVDVKPVDDFSAIVLRYMLDAHSRALAMPDREGAMLDTAEGILTAGAWDFVGDEPDPVVWVSGSFDEWVAVLAGGAP